MSKHKAAPDREMQALRRILRILEEVPAGSASRVLAYVLSRRTDPLARQEPLPLLKDNQP